MQNDSVQSPDNRSDAELTEAYRSGEGVAAAELYRRYYPKLLRGVATKLPSLEIAEDCVGDAFLSVLEIVQRGSGPTSNVYGYLRSAVVRECAKYYRDRDRGASVSLDDFLEQSGAQFAATDDLSRVEQSLLVPAMRALPARWREIIWLRYVEKQKPASIASQLGTDAPALHKMLYRAKNGLRDEYLKQLALSRSGKDCLEFARELAASVTSGAREERDERTESHLQTCRDCRDTLAELRSQSQCVSPETIGLGILIGGIVGGVALAAGQGGAAAQAASAGEATARSAATLNPLASTAKIASAGGVFQTLGSAGTITIVTLLAGSLAAAGFVYAESQSPVGHADTVTAAQLPARGQRSHETVRTDDGDCELTVDVRDGTLTVDAAVHAGKCWFTYSREGDDPGVEEAVSTGWMIVTRVPGNYSFMLRSAADSKSGTVTL